MGANIKKLGFSVDVSELQKKLIECGDCFNEYTKRTEDDTSPHRESSDIWVRYGDVTQNENVFLEEHDSVWYPVLQKIPEVLPIVFNVMANVGGERLGGVLITKLEKGKKVYPHTDTIGWHPNYYDKFYVPILNKKGAVFCFDDNVVDPNEGDVYWFRNDVNHWVENNSDSDRIAMVICIKPFEGVENLFRNRIDEIKTKHFYENGVYTRQMILPKGWYAQTHKHSFSHTSILSKGKVILTVDGVSQTYEAPQVLNIEAGKEHGIVAIEDSVWHCIHSSDRLDEEMLQEIKILKSNGEV